MDGAVVWIGTGLVLLLPPPPPPPHPNRGNINKPITTNPIGKLALIFILGISIIIPPWANVAFGEEPLNSIEKCKLQNADCKLKGKIRILHKSCNLKFSICNEVSPIFQRAKLSHFLQSLLIPLWYLLILFGCQFLIIVPFKASYMQTIL
jgi:hypothetical protein